MVKIITELTEIPQGGSVVIDFFATWCGPCNRIVSVYKELAEKYSNVAFLKVDVDESEHIASKFNVESLPTFVFLKNGVEVTRVEGANPNALIKQLEGF
jgi:thioredoxin 1